jgi:O-antigen/teichoic acid export membrane protein
MNDRRLVLRNTALLLVAQAVVTPLSIAVNAITARVLGPSEFGTLFLAISFVTFGMLFVEWGQGNVLTARAAQNRAQAGELLGSSLLFRGVAALAVLGSLLLVARYLGHDARFSRIVALCALISLLGTLAAAGQDVIRGFERVDFAAGSYVAFQYFIAAISLPVLWLGGRLVQLLLAQAFCALVGVIAVLIALRPLGVPALAVRRGALRELIAEGTPFLAFSLALVLQPSLDALLLARWASPEAIGWHAAAKRLAGVLVAPAGAIVGGLYPTLCRLYPSDRVQYTATARAAFLTTTLFVVPIALCCALFPDVGVMIFSRHAFGPAEDNLRVLSLFVFLTYFSMPLGTCLVSAGLTRAWTAVQLACVAISAALSALLIPWFQAHGGNGGLGVCVSTVVAEVAVLSAALWLVPKGVIDGALGKRMALALLAGAAMALAARLLAPLTSFVAAPISLVVYAACLHFTGGVAPHEEQQILAYVRRRLGRARATT